MSLELKQYCGAYFFKKNLLKTNLTIHKTDIVYLSETYLGSSFPLNDEILVIQG